MARTSPVCKVTANRLVLWQVEVQRVEADRHEGNLLYLLHVYCDTLSRLLEKHGFQSFGKYGTHTPAVAARPCCLPVHSVHHCTVQEVARHSTASDTHVSVTASAMVQFVP